MSEVRPEALAAWHALGGTLTQLRADDATVPCWSDPEAWTSDDHDVRAKAAAACAHCPALTACLLFADANAEPAHVWAGVDRTLRNPPATKRTKP